jgi:hypothetical protein
MYGDLLSATVRKRDTNAPGGRFWQLVNPSLHGIVGTPDRERKKEFQNLLT